MSQNGHLACMICQHAIHCRYRSKADSGLVPHRHWSCRCYRQGASAEAPASPARFWLQDPRTTPQAGAPLSLRQFCDA